MSTGRHCGTNKGQLHASLLRAEGFNVLAEEVCKRFGLNYSQLGRVLGVEPSQVFGWRAGKRRPRTTVFALLHVLLAMPDRESVLVHTQIVPYRTIKVEPSVPSIMLRVRHARGKRVKAQ